MNGVQKALGFALVIGGGYACAQSAKCDQATATCAEPVARVVTVGEEFVLAPGQRVTVGPSSLSVTFERVASDSRCPRDVQCVWAGDAAIRLQVVEQMGEPRAIELSINGERRTAPLGRFELQVVALTPDPVSTAPIQQPQYRLTLRLIERP